MSKSDYTTNQRSAAAEADLGSEHSARKRKIHRPPKEGSISREAVREAVSRVIAARDNAPIHPDRYA